MAQATVNPAVFLIDADAHQVRHDVAETLVMVPFDPDHFDTALGIRQLADGSEKLPMFFA
jgi:hypothetical protein